MLGTFESLIQYVKLKSSYIIDNWIFQLHYRLSFGIFLIATILVTSRQYIGEHIRCIADGGVPAYVMNTFCFFTTTFTLVKDLDAKMLDGQNIPHPGVGSYGANSTEPIKIHAYYQWVPFVLFGQGLMFYLTHLLWKKLEGGRLRLLVDGLQLAAFAVQEKRVMVSGKAIPSKEQVEAKMKQIRKAFIERIYINSSWSYYLIVCEILNLLHVILQVILTNKFLGGQFYTLGADVIAEGLESNVDPLDKVFPKVTKCTFYKYGPSGSIQLHDAMCVMALNVINEKIYTFLWFWFIFLFTCTALGLLWRFLTIILHARSEKFNQIIFSNACSGKLNPWNVKMITRHCNYTDWLFLSYLAKNIDGLVFRDIFIGLAEDLEDQSEADDNEYSKDTLLKSERFALPNEYKLE